jgi:hypothetical protein
VRIRIAIAVLLVAGIAAADPGTQPHELDNTNPPENTEAKCHACHAGGTDDDGKYFRPWDTWAGTMMAQAARDPLFLAALTVAEQDSPGIGNLCWRCHSPQGFVKGNASGLGTMLDDDDKEGVACDACHRSFDPSKSMPVVDPKGPYAGNGYLFWDPGLSKRGPYNDADSPAHTTIADPFTSSAELCGQCHQLSNPKVTLKDMSGADTGKPFPLDTTYTEWTSYAKTAGAKTCIECHMRQATGDLQLSTFASAKTRTKPRTHFFAAANVWGIDAVRAANPVIDMQRTLAFDTARAEALTTLQSAVKVEIANANATLEGNAQVVAATVRVTNLTGHKFPTGYADGRRATLRVQVLSQFVDASRYEAQHAQRSSGREWHIALSDTIQKDTRLPPKGFTPDGSTPIIGATYGDGFDEQLVKIPFEGLDGGPVDVVATVFYESTVPEMIKELAAANTTDMRGNTLQMIGAGQPTAIASAKATVNIPTPPMPMPMPMPKNGCSCNQAPASGDWTVMGLLLLVFRAGSKRSSGSSAPGPGSSRRGRTARSERGSRT